MIAHGSSEALGLRNWEIATKGREDAGLNDIEEVVDPLTGEIVDGREREQLIALHERLEEVALEILGTCRHIRKMLGLSPVRPMR